MKINNRILSILLAVILVLTAALPVSAMEIDPVQDVVNMSGGTETTVDETGTEPNHSEKESVPDAATPTQATSPPDHSEESDVPGADDGTETPLGYSSAEENGNFLLDCTPDQAAQLIAFYEFVRAQIAGQPRFQTFAAPGDGGGPGARLSVSTSPAEILITPTTSATFPALPSPLPTRP